MSALTAVAVLREAKTVLETNGWHAGSYYARAAGGDPAKAPVDLYGAINLAAGAKAPNLRGGPAVEAAIALIQHALHKRGLQVGIAEWNDEPGRVVGEALALLDEAVAQVEALDGAR
jgi:hypothetical protein